MPAEVSLNACLHLQILYAVKKSLRVLEPPCSQNTLTDDNRLQSVGQNRTVFTSNFITDFYLLVT
jgi:hypothetical protein